MSRYTKDTFTSDSLPIQSTVLRFIRQHNASGWKQTKLRVAYLHQHVEMETGDEQQRQLNHTFDRIIRVLCQKRLIWRDKRHCVFLKHDLPNNIEYKDQRYSREELIDREAEPVNLHREERVADDENILPTVPAIPISSSSTVQALPRRPSSTTEEQPTSAEGRGRRKPASYKWAFLGCTVVALSLAVVLVLVIKGIIGRRSSDDPTFAPSTSMSPSPAPTGVIDIIPKWFQFGLLKGSVVQLSKDGLFLVVGSPGLGRAKQYDLEQVPTPDGEPSFGQVRVFQYITESGIANEGKWVQVGQVLEGETPTDFFGRAVAISSDGGIIAAGAFGNSANGYFAGRVRVFTFDRQNNMWKQLGQPINGEVYSSYFGVSLAMSSDGSIIASGATGPGITGDRAGHVRCFQFNKTSEEWIQIGQTLRGDLEDEYFGASVALSDSGFVLGIGAPGRSVNGNDSGAVGLYEYEPGSGQWVQRGLELLGTAESDFGYTLALSADGDLVVVGAPFDQPDSPLFGTVHMYSYVPRLGQWLSVGDVVEGTRPNDRFGLSVALSADGTILAAGAPLNDETGISSGLVRFYRLLSNTWEFGEAIRGTRVDDFFGITISLSADGQVIAAGRFLEESEVDGERSGDIALFAVVDRLNEL